MKNRSKFKAEGLKFKVCNLGMFENFFDVNLKAFCFMLFALSFSCASSGKEEKEQSSDQASWYITLRGKVNSPQQGQIVIAELVDGGSTGWQDTIKLKSNNTFVKRIKLTEPG